MVPLFVQQRGMTSELHVPTPGKAYIDKDLAPLTAIASITISRTYNTYTYIYIFLFCCKTTTYHGFKLELVAALRSFFTF